MSKLQKALFLSDKRVQRLKKGNLCMYFNKFNNAPSFLCYGYDF